MVLTRSASAQLIDAPTCTLCNNSGHTILTCALRTTANSDMILQNTQRTNDLQLANLPSARDPSLFTGNANDEVKAWIEEVKVYLTLSGIDISRPDAVLRVGLFVGGEASKWNRRPKRSEDPLQCESLLDWFDALHTRFAQSTPARAL
jgi:hypothetical protein